MGCCNARWISRCVLVFLNLGPVVCLCGVFGGSELAIPPGDASLPSAEWPLLRGTLGTACGIRMALQALAVVVQARRRQGWSVKTRRTVCNSCQRCDTCCHAHRDETRSATSAGGEVPSDDCPCPQTGLGGRHSHRTFRSFVWAWQSAEGHGAHTACGALQTSWQDLARTLGELRDTVNAFGCMDASLQGIAVAVQLVSEHRSAQQALERQWTEMVVEKASCAALSAVDKRWHSFSTTGVARAKMLTLASDGMEAALEVIGSLQVPHDSTPAVLRTVNATLQSHVEQLTNENGASRYLFSLLFGFRVSCTVEKRGCVDCAHAC